MRNRVAIMHGVNLDALDRRPARALRRPHASPRLEHRIDEFARELGLEARFFQSNHEGAYVEELHRAPDYADGLLLNPGAWTHYAWAIRDALEISGLPGRRGPPLRHQAPRAVPAPSPCSRTCAWRASRARASTATGSALERLKGAL